MHDPCQQPLTSQNRRFQARFAHALRIRQIDCAGIAHGLEGAGTKEETLQRGLARLGRTEAAARKDRMGAAWKAVVALRLKEPTLANNRWLRNACTSAGRRRSAPTSVDCGPKERTKMTTIGD